MSIDATRGRDLDFDSGVVRSSFECSPALPALNACQNKLGSEFGARMAAVQSILSRSHWCRWFDAGAGDSKASKKTMDWSEERERAFLSFENSEAALLWRNGDERGLNERTQTVQASCSWRQPGATMPDSSAHSDWEACAKFIEPIFARSPPWKHPDIRWKILGRYRTVPLRLALEALQEEACTAEEKSKLLLFLRSPWKAQAQVVMRCLNSKPNPNAWVYYASIVAELGLDAARDLPQPVWPLNRRWSECQCRTSLHIAAGLGDIAPTVVGFMLASGADPNVSDQYGATPISELVFSKYTQEDQIAVIRLLVAAGADVNATPPRCPSSLHHAAKENALQTMAILVELGGRLEARNHQGWTPLDYLDQHCSSDSRQKFQAVLAARTMDRQIAAGHARILQPRL